MAGTHPVQIDDDAIAAVYARYIGESVEGEYIPGQDQVPPGGPSEENPWLEVGEAGAFALAMYITPAWEQSEDRMNSMSQAIANVLNRIWPGGPPKFANPEKPWLTLLYESVMWGKAGVDFQTFTFTHPRRPPRDVTEESEEVSREQHTQPPSNKPFTTSGGDGE